MTTTMLETTATASSVVVVVQLPRPYRNYLPPRRLLQTAVVSTP